MKLTELGFSDDFFKGKEKTAPVARVVTVHKDSYSVQNDTGEFIAVITGKIRYNADTKLDLPAVGDWVKIEIFDDNSPAIITEILPRKTALKRKTAGKRIEYQMIATNINTAFVMQSLDNNFNVNRLERYIATIHENNIAAKILLSKSDLISAEELDQKIKLIKNQGIKESVIAFSNTRSADIEVVANLLMPGQTYCLLGSSGVGKTTLLNKLVGEDRFATSEIRAKDQKGRHTTTKRHLVVVPGKGIIIDTPGMRELGNIDLTEGIKKTFNKIDELSRQCKFRDCSHTQEPKCAVLAALKKGEIDENHYNNYIKLRKEAEYNKMSYVEKRRKDKKLGKYYKQVMASKKSKKFDR